MRKEDLPLINKAIDEVVMAAIRELQAPRDMIGGHEQSIDVIKFFQKDCMHQAFIQKLMEYLSNRKLFATYNDETCHITVTINFAVCQMTPIQARALNEKFQLAVA